MGGTPSTNSPVKALRGTEAELVNLMMPVFYTKEEITTTEHNQASMAWQLVLNDKSPEYLRIKQDPACPYSSCMMFFYDTFYMRLFDIHPLSKGLFKSGIRSQGKFLVKMISLALSEMQDGGKFERTLVKLAEVHNERGVKAVEYGIVGEVLFWSLKYVLGPEIYTEDAHKAWVKIYCRMLTIMVPVAVAHEISCGSKNQLERFANAETPKFDMTNSSTTMSTMKGESDANNKRISHCLDELRNPEMA